MITRSSEPSLLRARGGGVKKNKSRNGVGPNSGSLTHGSLVNEPSLRALGASKKDIEYGLPHEAGRDPKNKSDDGVAKNARLVRTRKDPDPFHDPHTFGPNCDRSSRKRDYFKNGGAVESDMWTNNTLKKH